MGRWGTCDSIKSDLFFFFFSFFNFIMGWGVTISICKTYVFEFVFSLELHNFLGLLKSEGIYTTHFFLNLKLKKKKFTCCPQICGGLSLVGEKL